MCYFKLLLPTILLVVSVSVLQATTIHVPADSTTIQAGINGAVDGDTVLVADGTYTGDGNRDIDFHGKAIVVLSENGAESCVIDCEGSGLDPHRGFYFHNGEGSSSVVQGFTIQNGYAYGDLPQNSGGGMLIEDSSPTVTNCTFSGNTSYHAGGGMYNSYSSPTVTNCTFTGNHSTGGGGMANDHSNTTVTNCTFSGNSVGGVGGGMANSSSDATVTNCTFIGNLAPSNGGGMRNTSSSPTVTNCTFSGNIGSYSGGGGIYNWSNSRPIVTNCILWGDLPDEINTNSGYPIVTYSDVEGGYSGEGNINEDPMFVLADKDDYRLLWPSPCIDFGDPTLFDPDGTRSDMGAHHFNQNDYLTLYLTPNMTEVQPGWWLGVHFTAINRWDSPASCWLLSQARRSGGAWLSVLGPAPYTLPANYTAQVYITHRVPNVTPVGMYEYRSLIGMPPGTLYDSDSFTFRVIE